MCNTCLQGDFLECSGGNLLDCHFKVEVVTVIVP